MRQSNSFLRLRCALRQIVENNFHQHTKQKLCVRTASVLILAALWLGVAFSGYAQTKPLFMTRESNRLSVSAPAPVSSQSNSEFRKLSFEITLGGITPGGDLKGQFKSTFVGGGLVGYRFHKNLQLDGGVDVAFGATRINETVATTGGFRQLRDTEIFVPLGARFILPLAQDRVHLSFGGGGAFVAYSESVRTRPNEIITCYGCGSRSGGGSYALAQVKFFDSSKRLGVGFTARYFDVQSQGSAFNTSLTGKSKDHWLQLGASLGFHF